MPSETPPIGMSRVGKERSPVLLSAKELTRSVHAPKKFCWPHEESWLIARRTKMTATRRIPISNYIIHRRRVLIQRARYAGRGRDMLLGVTTPAISSIILCVGFCADA